MGVVDPLEGDHVGAGPAGLEDGDFVAHLGLKSGNAGRSFTKPFGRETFSRVTRFAKTNSREFPSKNKTK